MSDPTPLKSLVTLVFSTIGRNESVKRLVSSVRERYPDMPILSADQNGPTDEMEQAYRDYDVRMLWLPHDCGLSFARNRAFEKVQTPFVLLADDDFVFNEKTDLETALSIMRADPNLGVLGGSIVDRRVDENGAELKQLRRWEKFILPFSQARTMITIPIDYLPLQTRIIEGYTVFLCDMTSNWGLWRTEIFRANIRWDEQMKINGEHEDYFLTLKTKSKWLVAYFPEFQCDHVQPRVPGYNKLRYRLEGRRVFASKWNFSHHLELGMGLREYQDYLGISKSPENYPLPRYADRPDIDQLKKRLAALEPSD